MDIAAHRRDTRLAEARQAGLDEGLVPFVASDWDLLGGTIEHATLATIRGRDESLWVGVLDSGDVLVVFAPDGPDMPEWPWGREQTPQWLLSPRPMPYVDALRVVADRIWQGKP